MRRAAMMYVVASVLMLALAPCTFADIPKIIGYQGRVTDNNGVPVPDGTYDMQFSIWTVESGGIAPVWASGIHNVEVTDGTFNVLLGTVGPPLDLQFKIDFWLEVTIEGETQSPRHQFCSVGYAYMASGLVAGTEVSGSVAAGTNAALKATNTAPSGVAYGLHGKSASEEAIGVYGEATDTDAESSVGVQGVSYASSGTGVMGNAFASTGATHGVWGTSVSTDGTGVRGEAGASAGDTYGVYGTSASSWGIGVCGKATAANETGVGVYGESAAGEGRGVHGHALHTGGENYGGYFRSDGWYGYGVYGYAASTIGDTYGGYFESNSPDGCGVYGKASATTGQTCGGCFTSSSPDGWGVSGVGDVGGRFLSNSSESNSVGVYAELIPSTGGNALSCVSHGPTTVSVYNTDFSYGSGIDVFCSGAGRGLNVFVNSPDPSASIGGRFVVNASDGAGVLSRAASDTGANYGVFGKSDSPDGYGVYYSGGFGGTGLMRSVVMTSQGPTGLDVMTAAGNWVEYFGEGWLVNGRASIELDPLFLETVTIDERHPLKVFVELGGDCNGVYVEKGHTGFDVMELRGGSSSIPFDYRVVAEKKGFEDRRLEVVEAARRDSYLYPELREKEDQELEQKRAEAMEKRRRYDEVRAARERNHNRPAHAIPARSGAALLVE